MDKQGGVFTIKVMSILLLVILVYANINQNRISVRLESDLEHLCLMHGQDLYDLQRRRIRIALLVALIVPFLMFFEVSWPMLLLFIVLVFVIYQSPYRRLKKKHMESIGQLRYEFPIWLRQLQILLQSNTVAVSLEISTPMAPMMIRSHLQHLITQVKSSPQQIETYTDFLSGYRLMEVTRAMKLLFRYNAVGQSDAVKQLNRMVSTTGKWLRQQRLDSQSSQAAWIQWWGILPLLSVTIVFLVMMMVTITSFMERG